MKMYFQKYRLLFAPIFDSLMIIQVRWLVPILIIYLAFDRNIGFNPAYISIIIIASMVFSAVCIAFAVGIIQVIFKIKISKEGIRSSTNNFFAPFAYLNWDDIVHVDYKKWFDLEILVLKSSHGKVHVQLPLYVKNLLALKQDILQHISPSHPLRAYLNKQ